MNNELANELEYVYLLQEYNLGFDTILGVYRTPEGAKNYINGVAELHNESPPEWEEYEDLLGFLEAQCSRCCFFGHLFISRRDLHD